MAIRSGRIVDRHLDFSTRISEPDLLGHMRAGDLRARPASRRARAASILSGVGTRLRISTAADTRRRATVAGRVSVAGTGAEAGIQAEADIPAEAGIQVVTRVANITTESCYGVGRMPPASRTGREKWGTLVSGC
jgi:hypothetical protein